MASAVLFMLTLTLVFADAAFAQVPPMLPGAPIRRPSTADSDSSQRPAAPMPGKNYASARPEHVG
jgi:hypothetical protein